MEQTVKRINDWAETVFIKQTVQGKAAHLCEEAAELEAALISDPHSDAAKEELADCLILLYNMAFRMGMSVSDVIEAINRKMDKNEKRKWAELNEKGYSSHIET
ncbi:MAG: DUF550 domain-containing protein [Dysgonamonadaceae bacterium]|jgi:NTP pyrophosphatase (non-canonical NTP hydrolase)|nr:DUF550 domain-containing protein [Dysgonamonadaceae bacterium]